MKIHKALYNLWLIKQRGQDDHLLHRGRGQRQRVRLLQQDPLQVEGLCIQAHLQGKAIIDVIDVIFYLITSAPITVTDVRTKKVCAAASR